MQHQSNAVRKYESHVTPKPVLTTGVPSVRIRQAGKLPEPASHQHIEHLTSDHGDKFPMRVIVYQNYSDFNVDEPMLEYVINYNNISQRRVMMEQFNNAILAGQIMIFYRLDTENTN